MFFLYFFIFFCLFFILSKKKNYTKKRERKRKEKLNYICDKSKIFICCFFFYIFCFLDFLIGMTMNCEIQFVKKIKKFFLRIYKYCFVYP